MLALDWVQVIDEAVRAHTQMGAGPTGIEPVTPGYLRELFPLRVRCSSLTELRARVSFGKEPRVKIFRAFGFVLV
jgi:hypothetical protein